MFILIIGLESMIKRFELVYIYMVKLVGKFILKDFIKLLILILKCYFLNKFLNVI